MLELLQYILSGGLPFLGTVFLMFFSTVMLGHLVSQVGNSISVIGHTFVAIKTTPVDNCTED